MSTFGKALGLLLLILASSNLKAEDTNKIVPSLESVFQIDACPFGSQKEVLLVLNIGDISRSDSLFGYSLEIKYDPSKIRFDNVIWQNTLSEFFDTKDYSIVPKDSSIYVAAGNLNISLSPVSGKGKALVAFYGTWLADCVDSSRVNISYMDYTEEFKKTNDGFKDVVVVSKIKDEPDRIMHYSFDTESISFNSDSTCKVKLKFDTEKYKLSELGFSLDIDGDEFWIDKIETSNQNLSIDTVKNAKNGFDVKLNAIAPVDEGYLYLTIKNKGTIGTFNEKLVVNHISFGECDCLTRHDARTLDIESFIEDTTGIITKTDQKGVVYDDINQIISIKTKALAARNIRIYNMQGQLVDMIENNYEPIEINVAGYANGLYNIVIIQQDNKQIINLIKY